MTATDTIERPVAHELIVDRHLEAPRAALWRCWTEPALMERWFNPAPWTAHDVAMELRPGGAFSMTMRGPEGEEHPNAGVLLEVRPGELLVFTDAYGRAWEPAAKPFFTGIIGFEDEGAGTRYTAIARHWTAEDMAQHEEMGFHQGWNAAADQLEALAKTL